MESDSGTVLHVICALPVSSQYGPGSRLMYYILVVACVFARKQEWLRKVCLIATLVFPAIAAVHSIALAVLHDDGVVDMDVFGAFQLCAIGILAAPVTVRLSQSYFTNLTRNIISLWTILILTGLVSLTIEFYRTTSLTPDCPFTMHELDNEITPTVGESQSHQLHHVLGSLTGRNSSSPLRQGSANNIYVIAAPTRLTFGTATLLAASCCIPAVLSLVSMWNEILKLTFKRLFSMEEERKWKYEPLSAHDPLVDPHVAIMERLKIYVKIFLATTEIPLFSGAIFLILFIGERNFFSPQVSFQTQSISSPGEWALVFGLSLAATMGSLYLLLDANPGTEKKKTSPSALSKATPGSAHENRVNTMIEIRHDSTGNIIQLRLSRESSPPKAVKKAILALEGLSIRCQQWIFDGKQLDDSGRFIDYGIKERSSLPLLQDFTSVGPLQRPELNVTRGLKSLVPGIVQSSVVHWASRTVAIQRPRLGAKRIRVEWQCRCGHKSFDDFIQISEAGQHHLRQAISGSDTSSTTSRNSFVNGFRRTLSSGATSLLSSMNFKSSGSNIGGLPVHTQRSMNSQIQSSQTQPEKSPTTAEESIYLLLCYNERHWAIKLLHLDLMKLQAKSDTDLFKLLSDQYRQMRGGFLASLSLRTLVNIKFVYFDAHKSDLVDVRKEDDIPPPEHPDYKYEPVPPESVPPVGERYMMHLFHNPSHADENSFCLDRFPKKLKERLVYNGNVNQGWGLQFNEGWNAKKIWIISFVIFGLGSLAMGILWTFCHRSIQDAFAIASYMAAFATISIGTLQACLDT